MGINVMNRNKKLSRGLTASLAVGMSVMMGVAPVLADSTVSKEESVYVNADANGNKESVTVSTWLKNSGDVSGTVKDKSNLKDIKNVKGDETYTGSGDSMTWNTDGKDIYYQGTSDQELPVDVKLTYYLNGTETKPEDLKGKSGHLRIKVEYSNKEKKTVTVDGKQEEVYTPFVMMTGMIMDNDNFSNVTIDNGKVISDGNRSIVVGFGMPGMKNSLDLASIGDGDKDIDIPESLQIEADVTDFTMSSTYTVAMSDLLDDLDTDDITDVDELKDALDDLEDAALELVDGSNSLEDGAKTLSDGVDSYTKGADELNAAIQKYLGQKGQLSGSVTEYVNGVNKVVKGVKDYTDGTDTLADGVTAYVKGEKKLSDGAAQLSALSSGLTTVQNAISTLNAAMDGKGATDEDLKVASSELAKGTAAMEAALGSESIQKMLSTVQGMVDDGKSLISTAGELQKQLAEPLQNIESTLGDMQTQLTALQGSVNSLATAVGTVNAQIDQKNTELKTAGDTLADAKTRLESAKGTLSGTQSTLSDAKKKITDLSSKASDLRDKASDEENNGNSETAKVLREAASAIDGAVDEAKKANVDVETNVDTAVRTDVGTISHVEVDLTDTLKAVGGDVQTLASSVKTFGDTMTALSGQLSGVDAKLDSIQNSSDVLKKAGALKTLSSQVGKLNKGMQGLDKAIGNMAGDVSKLDSSVSSQFPTAIAGIKALNDGFAQLNAANDALVGGAAKLKGSSSTLVSGVETLQGGTKQLASGLKTLGSQMSSGSAKLSGNSAKLRDGAVSLWDGAKELAEGMDKFEKEGTSELKSTVEDDLVEVLDRIDALRSDECSYTSFSGKDAGMDGSVKFVIATDAIE